MEQNKVTIIIRLFLSARFPHDVEKRVQKWMINSEKAEEKEQASYECWNELDSEVDASTYAALNRVNRKIGHGAGRTNVFPLSPFSRVVARVAAVLIPVCLILGGYLYYTYTSEGNNLQEVSTAYGETRHLILPDGSEVWLNAGTTIRYEKNSGIFQYQKYRLVHLDGEAYFSVRRNAAKPFVVKTRQLSIKVLGTKFNLKAYPNDTRTITTLTSGKVEVSAGGENRWTLKPNQQMSYDNDGTLTDITDIASGETEAWMQGHLIFINSSFHDIMRIIERRFNMEIISLVDIPASTQYTIKFNRGEDLDEVLNILGEVVGFSYRREGHKVIVDNKPKMKKEQ